MSILYTIRVTLSKVSHISETERQMTHLPNRLSRGTTGLPSACPGAAHRGGRSRLAGDVKRPPGSSEHIPSQHGKPERRISVPGFKLT